MSTSSIASTPLPPIVHLQKVVAILRGCPFELSVPMAGAAIEAGLQVLEVTLDSERACDQIAAIKRAYPDAEIGVGSVLHDHDVDPAIDAGATFVVSPIVDPGTLERCAELGVPAVPGAATPTEIQRALQAGASAVKVFPIGQLGGPGYLRAVMSPLGSPPLIPTGGVTASNIGEHLRSGAIAAGVGGSVFQPDALRRGDFEEVGQLAAQVVEAVGSI